MWSWVCNLIILPDARYIQYLKKNVLPLENRIDIRQLLKSVLGVVYIVNEPCLLKHITFSLISQTAYQMR